KARGERHTRETDENWYQTEWAQKPGSFAAPTASLHFSAENLRQLENHGVKIVKVTLHVGLGTFLPVTTDDLNDHVMHSEWAEVPASTRRGLEDVRAVGGKVWALGTTVTRTLESAAQGMLNESTDGGCQGLTDLLIQPGYEWQVVDR